jgi:carbohydrate diacid regulator
MHPLNAELAAEFLRKLGRHLDYNINIMDRDGIIIASRDGSRVGSFHESAHRLIATGAELERVEPDQPLPPGVRPGVNLPIEHRGQTIGVVGVTGDPRVVAPVAYAVKTSVESMVELEAFKDRALQRLDKKNLLIRYLLYDAGVSRSTVEDLALMLGYGPALPRVPVLLRLAESLGAADALSAMKAGRVFRPGDISWATPEGGILAFKTIDLGERGVLADYDAGVERYADDAARALGDRLGAGERPFRAYAGIFQTDLSRYRDAYEQVLWLEGRCRSADGHLFFFDRHLGEYLASRVPRPELVAAFEPFADLISEEYGRELSETLRALESSAYNGKEAAFRLGVHRNTLAARLERIEAVFGVDPRADGRAREFFFFFARYLALRTAGPSR